MYDCSDMYIYLVLANDKIVNHFAYYFPMFLYSMLGSAKVLCARSNCTSRDHGHGMQTYPATGCCIANTESQRVSSLAWFGLAVCPCLRCAHISCHCGSAKRMTDWTFVLHFACLVYLIRDSVPFVQWYELAEAMRGEGDIGDGLCEWRRRGWRKALCGEVVGVLVGARMRVKGMSRSKSLAGGTTNVFKCRTASGT